MARSAFYTLWSSAATSLETTQEVCCPTQCELTHRRELLEPMRGYDPRTCGLRNRCSTTELHRRRDGGCSRRSARRWQATRRASVVPRSPRRCRLAPRCPQLAGGPLAPPVPSTHPSATSTPSSLRLSAPTSPPSTHPNWASSSSRKIASRKSPRPSDSLATPASPRSASVRVDPIGTPAAASVDPRPSAEITCVSDALRNRCSTTELHRRRDGGCSRRTARRSQATKRPSIALDRPSVPPGAPPFAPRPQPSPLSRVLSRAGATC
jgi:hypothetical protein